MLQGSMRGHTGLVFGQTINVINTDGAHDTPPIASPGSDLRKKIGYNTRPLRLLHPLISRKETVLIGNHTKCVPIMEFRLFALRLLPGNTFAGVASRNLVKVGERISAMNFCPESTSEGTAVKHKDIYQEYTCMYQPWKSPSNEGQ